MKRKKKKGLSKSGCPCGGDSYATCCRPFHDGGEPETPEQLMRARFSAFVHGKTEFLWRTLHPDHDDKASSFDAFVERMKGTRSVDYRELTVLDHRAPNADGAARVLFHVSARMGGKDASFMELSWFAREQDGWRYLVGKAETVPVGWRELRIKE